MEVFEIKNSTKGSYAYKVFNLPEDAEMRFASLNVGSKSRGFSLTEIKNTELPSLDGIKMTTAVIQVEGLREIYKQIDYIYITLYINSYIYIYVYIYIYININLYEFK